MFIFNTQFFSCIALFSFAINLQYYNAENAEVDDQIGNLFSEIYPNEIRTNFGQTETLSCLIISLNATKHEGLEPYEVTWYKNSLDNQLSHNKLELTIKILSHEDLGSYYCRLKNTNTNVFSNFATAIIRLKSKHDSEYLLDDYEQPKLDSKQYSTSSNTNSNNSSDSFLKRLSFSKSSLLDGKENQINNDDKPKLWIEDYRNGTNIFRVGEAAFIFCHGSGNPRPYLEWKRVDGKNLGQKESVEIQEEYALLEITDLSLNDSAKYVCIGKNSLGESRELLNINVLPITETQRTSNNLFNSIRNTNFEKIKFNLTFISERKFRLESQKYFIQNYIDNDEIPGELSAVHFPEPLVQESEQYSYGYRQLIQKFQKDILEYTNKYLDKQLILIEKYIETLKNDHSRSIENLDSKIEKIQERVKNENFFSSKKIA